MEFGYIAFAAGDEHCHPKFIKQINYPTCFTGRRDYPNLVLWAFNDYSRTTEEHFIMFQAETCQNFERLAIIWASKGSSRGLFDNSTPNEIGFAHHSDTFVVPHIYEGG